MKKYNTIVFIGKYMCKEQCRGVQRYTKEVLHALDRIVSPGQIKLVIPYKIKKLDRFENIEVVMFGGKLTSKLWQFFAYQVYIWKYKAFSVSLSSCVQLFDIGAVAIHDVRYIQDLEKRIPFKTKIGLMMIKYTCKNAIKNGREVITVSEFSKNEIIKAYNVKDGRKISVCYNSWQHLIPIETSENILKTNNLKKSDYYFSLGGNEESKNMLWIAKMVVKYPDRLFVMAGPKNFYFPSENIDLNQYKNFVHLGYVTDEELKSLMKYCKAFLFPSKYEGFGIPPMEAISVGAKVIMSNAACLPEVYKNYVSYFDPFDYDADLDILLSRCPDNSAEILEYYSWDKTAKKVLEIIKKYVK